MDSNGKRFSGIQSVREYTEQLHELDKAHQRGLNASKQLRFLSERIHEKEMEMDELKGDQNVKESEKRKLENEIVSINERLKLEGLDEIRARIQYVQRAISEGESVEMKSGKNFRAKSGIESKGREIATERAQRSNFGRI